MSLVKQKVLMVVSYFIMQLQKKKKSGKKSGKKGKKKKKEKDLTADRYVPSYSTSVIVCLSAIYVEKSYNGYHLLGRVGLLLC